MTQEHDLDVVIVSYRCRELLRACLASLREHVSARVIVVDNASADGTVELVRAEFPEVELVAADRNLGFAAATNLGITRGDAPLVLALNPDTRLVEPLGPLLEVLEAHPQVAVVGPRLERADGTFDHAARRSFPTPLGALAHFTGVGRREGASGTLAQYRAPGVERGPVDAVNGAFMLMRRAALDEVGLFDEGYWMYMEDLDLSYRLAQAGWQSWYEPTVTVVHEKHGTSGDLRSPRLLYHFHYGMFRFYRRHYASGSSIALNALVYAGIGGKLALSLATHAVRTVRRMAGLRRRLGPLSSQP